MSKENNYTYRQMCDVPRPSNVLVDWHPVDTLSTVLTMIRYVLETLTTDNAGEDVVLEPHKQEALYYILESIYDAVDFEKNRADDMVNFLHDKTYQPREKEAMS